MHTMDWSIRILLDEDGDHTHARAVLTSRDGISLHADGDADRNPGDAPIPEIGAELATARALYSLAELLMDTAAHDVENLSHHV